MHIYRFMHYNMSMSNLTVLFLHSLLYCIFSHEFYLLLKILCLVLVIIYCLYGLLFIIMDVVSKLIHVY